MYGVVTRNAEEADWSGFDRAVYEVSAPNGRGDEPIPGATAAVSCFADTASVDVSPELAQRDAAGDPAVRGRAGHEWSSVCPVAGRYRAGVLETIADAGSVAGDVRLDQVGFAGAAFCHCERCAEAVAAFDGSRSEWRSGVVTTFVADAAARVPGRCSLSVHPDPSIGRLRERSGLDLPAVAPHVDELVVPLYDQQYGTTYWAESLAAGFAELAAARDLALGVELYAADVSIDALSAATDAVAPHADVVYYGYGAGTARAVLRRRRAEAADGVEHHP